MSSKRRLHDNPFAPSSAADRQPAPVAPAAPVPDAAAAPVPDATAALPEPPPLAPALPAETAAAQPLEPGSTRPGPLTPYLQLGGSWLLESERFGRLALDGMTRALEHGHSLARESLSNLATMTSTVQKRWVDQLERGFQLLGGKDR